MLQPHSTFLPEIDRLRGVAIMLVVVSHTFFIAEGTDYGRAVYSGLRGATWPFVFISGYLFAHLQHRYSYGSYLISKARTVIAPYVLVVSCIAAAGIAYIPLSSPAKLLYYYLLGFPAATPLWFVPVICLFFVCFPIYRRLCDQPNLLLAGAGLAIAVAMALGRPSFASGPLLNFVYFQSAYLCGMAWCRNKELVDRIMERNLPLLVLALLVGASIGIGDPQHVRMGQIFGMMPLTAMLMIVLRGRSILDPAWEWLATRSFGIFFLHGIVTDRLPELLGDRQGVLPALGLGIALTFACGLAVSAVRQVAGPRSRVLIGS